MLNCLTHNHFTAIETKSRSSTEPSKSIGAICPSGKSSTKHRNEHKKCLSMYKHINKYQQIYSNIFKLCYIWMTHLWMASDSQRNNWSRHSTRVQHTHCLQSSHWWDSFEMPGWSWVSWPFLQALRLHASGCGCKPRGWPTSHPAGEIRDHAPGVAGCCFGTTTLMGELCSKRVARNNCWSECQSDPTAVPACVWKYLRGGEPSMFKWIEFCSKQMDMIWIEIYHLIYLVRPLLVTP